MDDDQVKIRFPWDRDDSVDDTGSNWIRVSQMNTSSFAPEVDDEVLVQFEHGDLRQPVVVGSLYNGGDAPPSDLPGGQVVSGMKSNSTQGGGNDATETVGGNRAETVGANKTITVGANQTESVGINYSETVGAAMEVTVGATMSDTGSEEDSGTDGDWFIG